MADLSKTLFVTDLDGTLLNSDMALSDRTVELLNEVIDKGVNFTFASARSWNSAYPLLERLNLKVPAVTYNGAFIVDPADGSTITSHVFEKPEIDFLKNCFAGAKSIRSSMLKSTANPVSAGLWGRKPQVYRSTLKAEKATKDSAPWIISRIW